jgi:hypothetical protein
MKDTSRRDELAYPFVVIGAIVSLFALFFFQTATIIAPAGCVAAANLIALAGTIIFTVISVRLGRKLKQKKRDA